MGYGYGHDRKDWEGCWTRTDGGVGSGYYSKLPPGRDLSGEWTGLDTSHSDVCENNVQLRFRCFMFAEDEHFN